MILELTSIIKQLRKLREGQVEEELQAYLSEAIGDLQAGIEFIKTQEQIFGKGEPR